MKALYRILKFAKALCSIIRVVLFCMAACLMCDYSKLRLSTYFNKKHYYYYYYYNHSTVHKHMN